MLSKVDGVLVVHLFSSLCCLVMDICWWRSCCSPFKFSVLSCNGHMLVAFLVFTCLVLCVVLEWTYFGCVLVVHRFSSLCCLVMDICWRRSCCSPFEFSVLSCYGHILVAFLLFTFLVLCVVLSILYVFVLCIVANVACVSGLSTLEATRYTKM